MGKGNRGDGRAGVRGAPMIATAADTNKTAERVTGIERGRVTEKTEAGVGEDVCGDCDAVVARVESQRKLVDLSEEAVKFNAVCKPP